MREEWRLRVFENKALKRKHAEIWTVNHFEISRLETKD
jgi:hypothetical protein